MADPSARADGIAARASRALFQLRWKARGATRLLTEDEWAAEMADRTVHSVVHVGWVPEGTGYRGQMAVLVRPNGWLGAAYMALIKRFRHLIVYPALMCSLERGSQRRDGEPGR